MISLAGIVVVVAGVCLISLAVVIVASPKRGEKFLTGFVSSARLHFVEQATRILVGTAIILFHPKMQFPDVFQVFGWLLASTSAGLLLIPWRWHQRFARWVIPAVIRYMKFYAFGVFALGVFILYGVAWK